jgi:predicted nucleic acid-binding Zn ribbon protein
VQEAPPQPPAATPPGGPAPQAERCPVCGTPTGPGQEFCLSCGNRLTPHYRRPPSWRLVAGLAAASVLAIGAGTGAAIGLSGGHDKSPVHTTTTTTQGAAPPAAPAPAPQAPTATTPAKPGTTATAPGGKAPSPTPGKPTTPAVPGAAVWPPGKEAYTVDLLETPSEKEAKAKAKAAIKKGIPAGVLQSDGYRTLPPGLYVVFAGQYRTSKEATTAANGYADKGFGSAYARLIQPKA